ARMWTRLHFFAAELDFHNRFAPAAVVAQLQPEFEFVPAIAAPASAIDEERLEAPSTTPEAPAPAASKFDKAPDRPVDSELS
ncbi:MAG: hypothetical protein ACREEM_18750, partial [Blastocatellia bacterium]